ncbi:MAG: hypothetical protein K0R66_1151 [Gammaproteobacteria bacterium]|jgi:hypothetical protein|nr:hypothetical protein [Gammaproteobacteria bacterium]
MNAKNLKDFILDFYDAWKSRDADRIKNFYDENLIGYSDFQKITVSDIMTRLKFGCEKFAESHYQIDDIFVDELEGKVAVRMKQRHVLSDGSGDLKFEAIMLYTVANNKIKEVWMSYFPNSNYLKNEIPHENIKAKDTA